MTWRAVVMWDRGARERVPARGDRVIDGQNRWRWPPSWAALCLLLIGVTQINAQQASVLVPAPPANVVAAKAYAMLERNCAGCHQAGKLEGRPPAAGIANLLALDEIARDPSLVRPGVPDASRIYNVALTHELHLDEFNDPAVAIPSSTETQALRDWIGDLSQQQADRCGGRLSVPQARVGQMIEGALAAQAPERARQTRFLSLAHLHNACLADAELDALRQAIPGLIAALSPQGARRPGEGWARPIDDARLVYEVSLTSLGWRAEQWNTLVAGFPLRAISAAATPAPVAAMTGSVVTVVHADWFADAVASSREKVLGEDTTRLWGLPVLEALAHAWRRPADLARATADLGLPAGQKLTELPGWGSMKDRAPTILLRSGSAVRRNDLDLFLTALTKSPASERQPTQSMQLEIAVAADKAVYKAGETATFHVVASRDCHLTLVSIDRGGRATVLFPNELAPENRIAGGNLVEVPAASAPYRLRFKEKGRETIVAICSENHKSPIGITHDYDRLRFTVLGDWQLFLREPPEMREARRDDAATDVPRPLAKPRRRGRPGETVAVPAANAPDIQTRTAITLDIE